jgi:phage gp29-like protein
MKILNYFTSKQKQPTVKTKDYELYLRPPDRTAKDLASLKTALSAAERSELRSRYMLYDIYKENIDFDGHLRGLLRKRTDSILKNDIIVERGGKLDEELTGWLNSGKFNQFIRELHETVYWGFSLFEFSKLYDRDKAWFDYYLVNRKHVRPHEKQIIKNQYDNAGMSYAPMMEGVKRTVSEVGNPEDLGLLLTASVYSIIKRNAINDWGSYSERAGRNFEMVKFKRGDEHLRNEVMQALNSTKTGGVVGLPEGVEVEIQSGGSNNVAQAFENLIKWCNDEQSKLILGNVMTTDAGSSRAQAEVHESQQSTIERADNELVLNYLNYEFWEYLPLWGIDNTNIEFKFQEMLDVVGELDKDAKLKALGYNFTPEQIAEKYGLEKP